MILTVTLNPALDLNLETPRIEADRVLRAASSRMDAGGKGVNVSRAIHENGGETRALILVGGDMGRVFERMARRHGFPVVAVRGAGETRINVVVAQGDHASHIKVNQAGPTLAAGEWERSLRAFSRALRGASYAVLSGSLPPAAPVDGYARMIARARRAGVRVVLDADREALRRGIEARPWAVKPNRAELEEYAGRALKSPRDVVSAARAILERGVELVVASDGPRATYAVTSGGVWRAHPPRIRARGVVGAGDSLVAGLVAGLDAGKSLPEALRQGVAWGAATALAPDTQLCRREDAEAMAEKVKVENW